MYLSDLLGVPVHARDGRQMGRVVDVRFRRADGGGRGDKHLELIALIVSPRTRLSFYGYERGRVNRPIVLAKLISWLHRGSQVIPWGCVERITDEGVLLGVEPPRIPLDDRRPISAS
jgi:sporulation protein YlmC with PRC-barrel domain